jgi:hypothetical protein
VKDTEIIEALQNRLGVTTGRHLFGVVGTYASLDRFVAQLMQARPPSGGHFPRPRSVNQGILDAIPDEEFRQLVSDEARRPEPTAAHVGRAFETFLRSVLKGKGIVILKDLELVFAYGLELRLLRSLAADADQVLLLLPGRREGGKVVMFAEAGETNYALPSNLIADNHLWELRS